MTDNVVEFTKEMKKTHKLLFPNMCDIHFRLLTNVFKSYGYDVELLTNSGREVVDEGLKYVHNDTCYPALLTIGQMISALKSGKYDLEHTALMMSQTGGGCRASNYIHLLRKALKNAGFGNIPVVSVSISFGGIEKSSGFKITFPMLRRALAVVCYGDLLMLLKNQTKPYEIHRGDADKLVDRWIQLLSEEFAHKRAISAPEIKQYFSKITESFDNIKVNLTDKIKVGVVGEVYAKYSPLANNHLEEFLYNEGCEVMLPGLFSFILYIVDSKIIDAKLYGGHVIKRTVSDALLNYLLKFETYMHDSIRASRSGRFSVPCTYKHLKELSKPVIGLGCQMGEGWFLPSEMMELVVSGYENIVCVQPFGCLPNHIVGKGVIRNIKREHPQANIVPIDYDPGATMVNQENRIKLMLSIARENLEKKKAAPHNDTAKKEKLRK